MGLVQSLHIAVESYRPHASAAHLGMETVGYMEPCWVRWLKAIRNGHTHFHAVRNFTRMAAKVGNALHLSH